MGNRITIQDIADVSGISKSTISRVISNNGYVDEKTRRLVSKYISELGYKPQKKHKGKGVSDLVMITSGLLMSPVHITIIESIVKELESNGLKAMISYNSFDDYKLEEYLLYARDRDFAGVIIIGFIETPKLINCLKTMKCPIVLFNQEFKGMDVNVVGMDDFQGGYLAAKYLIEKGHKRIGLLMGYKKAKATLKRETGFREAMKDYGLKVKDSDIYYGDFTEKSGLEYADKVFKNRVDITAIVSCNDLMTVGLNNRLIELGYKIPEDMSIVGFDDSLVTKLISTKLTTISYDFYRIGKTAAEMVLDSINNPLNSKRKISFSPTLMERDSVKIVC